MADTPTFQSNPYGSFDPSQWTNPYSNFYGKALPWPSSYAGTPTNALGQPIQPQPGMTLNSTPAQPQAPQAAGASAGPMVNFLGTGPQSLAGVDARQAAQTGTNPALYPLLNQQMAGGMQQAPQAAAPAAPNNWQSTLSMLANPGHVTTPGATVPQAPQGGGQPSPGVLQNFLANWQPQQSGAGSGFTQNFNSILRGLQAKGS
jgi:hypothetical protein